MDSCDTDSYKSCQDGALGDARRLVPDFLERRLGQCHNICGDKDVSFVAFYDHPGSGQTPCIETLDWCSMVDCGIPCEDLQKFFSCFTDCCTDDPFDMSGIEGLAAGGGGMDFGGEGSNDFEDHSGAAGGGGMDLWDEDSKDFEDQFGAAGGGGMDFGGEDSKDLEDHSGAAGGGGMDPWGGRRLEGVVEQEGCEDEKERLSNLMKNSDMGGFAEMMTGDPDSTDSPLAVKKCDQHMAAISCWAGDCCTGDRKDNIVSRWKAWKDGYEAQLREGQTMPDCSIECPTKASNARRPTMPAVFGAAALLALSGTSM
jgi:hypothetical protein